MGRVACALQSPGRWPHLLDTMTIAISRDMCSVQIEYLASSYRELLHCRLFTCWRRGWEVMFGAKKWHVLSNPPRSVIHFLQLHHPLCFAFGATSTSSTPPSTAAIPLSSLQRRVARDTAQCREAATNVGRKSTGPWTRTRASAIRASPASTATWNGRPTKRRG